jgi:alpha-amylase
LTNNSPQPVTVRFGIELNFSLLSGYSPHAYYEIEGYSLAYPHLGSTGETERVVAFRLVNRDLGLVIRVKVDPEATLWRFPIETVSLSESGFERIYQASCLFLHWGLRLEPGQVWPTSLLIEFDKIEP